MRILPLIAIAVCLASQVLARPQEDAEPRPAPARGLLKRGPPNKGKTTTTTTLAPAPEDAEYDEEAEYPAESEAQEPSTEAPASSTEGKKLVGSGVRPFRSNTDLLETLKRRRAQAAEAKHSAPPASQNQDVQGDGPVKAAYSKKRFNTATRETKAEDASAAKSGKSRFSRPSSPKASPETDGEEPVEPAPSARTGRTFARRGN